MLSPRPRLLRGPAAALGALLVPAGLAGALALGPAAAGSGAATSGTPTASAEPSPGDPSGSSGSSSGGSGGEACEVDAVPESAKMASAVFTGTVESVTREEVAAGESAYLTDVVVDRVYKPGRGSVIDSEQVEVVTQQSPGGCGLGPLTEGERYVVFADLSGEVLLARGEGGTAVADAALVAQVRDLLGAGRPPVAPQPPTAELTRVDGSTPTAFTSAALPGAVMVLVGLIGLLVTRRLGRPD